jgi:hypothetical protein
MEAGIMADVISLKNGEISTVFDLRDALELVERYAGYELRRYLESWAEELESDARDFDEQEKYYQSEQEKLQDGFRSVLVDLRDDADEILKLMSAQRWDQDKIFRSCSRLRDRIDREL